MDDAEKLHYWNSLLNDWGVGKRMRHFPGCNPVSISRSTLAKFKQRDRYSISLKSDGVRYVLYCTVRPGSTEVDPLPVALMIDRSQNMYEVDLMAPEEVFTRHTIIEGELVWRQPEETTLVFLAFDCVLLKGRLLTGCPFSERLEEVTRCTRMSEDLSQDEDVAARVRELDCLVLMQYAPRVVLRNKVFVHLDNAVRLWNDRSEVQHRVDGVILQRNDARYVCGGAKNGESYKWKEKSTVDLIGWDLSTGDGPLADRLYGRNIRRSTQSVVVPTCDTDVVEYLVVVKDHEIELFAIRRRVDKTTANARRVVEATIRDVIDGVRVDEL